MSHKKTANAMRGLFFYAISYFTVAVYKSFLMA